MSESKTPWIVGGGASGELGYCQRCGAGLGMGGGQPLYLAVAMMKAFTQHHSRCADTGRVEPSPANAYEWFNGRDTGTSSLTIYSVFMHTDSPHGQYNIPSDPEDFGRCYRLLKIMPQWRFGLQQVADNFPAWQPLVDHWDELTALYEEELPDGTAPRLYARMKELRDV